MQHRIKMLKSKLLLKYLFCFMLVDRDQKAHTQVRYLWLLFLRSCSVNRELHAD